MRIYSMTATFGKLEHQTLTLQPGLNVIHAPNEWGKSTWCAFLLAMLYGLDTRAKTTKTALADKERFEPWSGSLMEGRIDLNWNGRDITIARRTRRRIPLGEFTAYETASGLPVEELTAANCGQMLLGVEQTVFRRAGFIRHRDLPVTQDEALRRRLNALVTTGDESGAADRLAEELKDLKNRCRYNKTGLLPQAEAQRDALEEKLAELQTLEERCRKIKLQLGEIKTWLEGLNNHRQTLAYRAAEANAQRMAQAREEWERLEQALQRQEAACGQMPPMEQAQSTLRELRAFREEWNSVQMERQMLPQEPREPQLPQPFTGMSLEEARKTAQSDAKAYTEVNKGRLPVLLVAMGILGILASALLIYLTAYVPAGVAMAASLVALGWGIWEWISGKRQKQNLVNKYGSAQWAHWADPLDSYAHELFQYQNEMKRYRQASGDVEVRYVMLNKRRAELCQDQDPETLLTYWQQVQEAWEGYHATRRETARAKSHFETLRALVKPVEKPAMPDEMTFSEEETLRLLNDCAEEQQRLQNRLGQYQGRMEVLGDKAGLETSLEEKKRRITQLESTYAALSTALETLAEARAELQRRFAPRITRRAQELLSAMTGGRYHSVTMGQDFSLQAAAGEEDTLRDCLWRSDGTMDQLYLALRLAVAEELTPEAPLILDDALVRFDDQRMKAAMEILKEMSKNRQVICFTCQKRETEA